MSSIRLAQLAMFLPVFGMDTFEFRPTNRLPWLSSFHRLLQPTSTIEYLKKKKSFTIHQRRSYISRLTNCSFYGPQYLINSAHRLLSNFSIFCAIWRWTCTLHLFTPRFSKTPSSGTHTSTLRFPTLLLSERFTDQNTALTFCFFLESNMARQ